MPQLMVVRLPGLPPLLFPLFALWMTAAALLLCLSPFLLIAAIAVAARDNKRLSVPAACRLARAAWGVISSLSGFSAEFDVRGRAVIGLSLF